MYIRVFTLRSLLTCKQDFGEVSEGALNGNDSPEPRTHNRTVKQKLKKPSQTRRRGLVDDDYLMAKNFPRTCCARPSLLIKHSQANQEMRQVCIMFDVER